MEKFKGRPVIIWKSTSVYVDIETGEQITKWNAENNYIIIKTEKHVSFNYSKTKAEIQYTKSCQKDLKLF